MSETQDILFTEMSGRSGSLGIITLNRPAVLNSLNHDMIVAMHPKLLEWAEAAHIKAVVIRAGEGRAFCAGGDLRLTYERATQKNPLMTEFFNDEYQLNRTIHHFPKPYIALLDGITMGGGVGLSIHGSHRVATERLLFAMPETGIGFFPDVGGTYFLPRLPARTGYYLGLTGARIKADDATALGLTTHKVNAAAINEILSVLTDTEFSGDGRASVTTILNKFSQPLLESAILTARDELEACFRAKTVEEMMQLLAASPHQLCQDALSAMQKKSPTSLKVTLEALAQGENMDFDACMQQEFRLVSRFLLAHDFIEGIRAVIIDKDQSPVWQPASLNEINAKAVAHYFAPLSKELA
jgi:enoyl-CoA hydratase/carnithine racemase